MSVRELTLGVAVSLAMSVLPAGPAAAQAGADPAAGWAEMARCGALANDAARHSCMDEVLRKNGAMAAPEARTVERRRTFGLDVLPTFPHREHVKAEPSAGRGGRPVQVADADDRVTVTLDGVTLRGDGRLAVKTSEGAIWRQVEDEPVRPTPVSGQSMTIERTAMGGYMCKSARWTAFRCTRAP